MSPTPLKDFVCALASPGTGPKTIPADLTSIARGLLRHGGGDEAQDLVGDLMTRLLVATRRSTAASVVHLLDLTEPELRAVFRHRMKNAAVERAPARRQSKQIRDQVRIALGAGLPPAPVALPTSLMEHDKLSGPAVAAAVAWVLAQHDAPVTSDVAGIADKLMGLSEGRHDVEQEPALGAAELVEAKHVATMLRDQLKPEVVNVLCGRLRGTGLAELAAEQGMATSTVHAHLGKAIQAARAVVRRAGCGEGVGRLAIETLAGSLAA
jgi:DNA-directed RNA polymerase specialized sigma24 family protein